MNSSTSPYVKERLQKVLARIGLGSRREIEAWIEAGRVEVNGELAKLGDRVGEDDTVCVDGTCIKIETQAMIAPRVLVLNKEEGFICSQKDPDGRPTVFDALPKLQHGRWIQVGRLDLNTSGLLMFTTDGELANRLMHPSYQIDREYAVRVFGEVPENAINNLKKGVQLDDGPAKFDDIQEAGGEGINRWYHVVVREGRNREVRRLWETQNVKVSRLIRVRYGILKLPRDLKAGEQRELSLEWVNELRQMVDMPKYQPQLPLDKQPTARRRQTRMQRKPKQTRRFRRS